MKFSDVSKVFLVTVACILALSLISRYALGAQMDVLSQNGPVLMFAAYIVTKNVARKSKMCRSPLYWSLAIIAVTAAALVVNAI